jgi:hypothetical protein
MKDVFVLIRDYFKKYLETTIKSRSRRFSLPQEDLISFSWRSGLNLIPWNRALWLQELVYSVPYDDHCYGNTIGELKSAQHCTQFHLRLEIPKTHSKVRCIFPKAKHFATGIHYSYSICLDIPWHDHFCRHSFPASKILWRVYSLLVNDSVNTFPCNVRAQQ